MSLEINKKKYLILLKIYFIEDQSMIILKLEKNKNKLNFNLSNELRKNTMIKGAEAIVL